MAEFAWDNRIRGKYMKTRTCKLLLIAMASSMVWMSPDTAHADETVSESAHPGGLLLQAETAMPTPTTTTTRDMP